MERITYVSVQSWIVESEDDIDSEDLHICSNIVLIYVRMCDSPNIRLSTWKETIII